MIFRDNNVACEYIEKLLETALFGSLLQRDFKDSLSRLFVREKM